MEQLTTNTIDTNEFTRLFCVTPDYVANPRKSGDIELYDNYTGVLTHTLTGHTDSLTGLLYVPSKKILISSSTDYTMKIWNMATEPKLIYTLRFNKDTKNPVWPKNIFVNKHYIISDEQYYARILDINTFADVKFITAQPTINYPRRDCYFIEGVYGNLLLSHFGGNPNEKIIYCIENIANGTVYKQIEFLNPMNDCATIVGCNFIYRERYLIFGTGSGNIYIHDITSGELIRKIKHPSTLVASCFKVISADNYLISSMQHDSNIHIWNFETGDLLHTINIPESDSYIRPAFYNIMGISDSRYICSSYVYRNKYLYCGTNHGMILVIDIAKGHIINKLTQQNNIIGDIFMQNQIIYSKTQYGITITYDKNTHEKYIKIYNYLQKTIFATHIINNIFKFYPIDIQNIIKNTKSEGINT
jgi:WD40 repeat protein